jgi:hypothetical protein
MVCHAVGCPEVDLHADASPIQNAVFWGLSPAGLMTAFYLEVRVLVFIPPPTETGYPTYAPGIEFSTKWDEGMWPW